MHNLEPYSISLWAILCIKVLLSYTESFNTSLVALPVLYNHHNHSELKLSSVSTVPSTKIVFFICWHLGRIRIIFIASQHCSFFINVKTHFGLYLIPSHLFKYEDQREWNWQIHQKEVFGIAHSSSWIVYLPACSGISFTQF